jgi:hypothetical protein
MQETFHKPESAHSRQMQRTNHSLIKARPGLPGQEGPQTRAPDRRAGGRATGVCL